MALLDDNALQQTPNFRRKVKIAMVKAANAITGEAANPPTLTQAEVDKRHTLAQEIYRSVGTDAAFDYMTVRFANACAAQGTLTELSTDNDIEFTVNAVYDDLAGITALDKV